MMSGANLKQLAIVQVLISIEKHLKRGNIYEKKKTIFQFGTFLGDFDPGRRVFIKDFVSVR